MQPDILCLWVYCVFNSSLIFSGIYLRPDHVVGVESVAEPKTQENVQKRKEVVERLKSKEEGRLTNSSLLTNG